MGPSEPSRPLRPPGGWLRSLRRRPFARERGERVAATTPATRAFVSAVGVLAAYAGVEHGIGEIRQGAVRPPAIVFESWPDTTAFEALGGEPAMTVVPSLAVTGVLAIVAAVAVGAWALWGAHRGGGGRVLVALSVVLLLVGGGFGPPLLGIVAGVAAVRAGREGCEVRAPAGAPGRATRALAHAWPWSMGACALGYLALVPGVPLLAALAGSVPAAVVALLIVFAFATLALAFVSARAADRLRAAGVAR